MSSHSILISCVVMLHLVLIILGVNAFQFCESAEIEHLQVETALKAWFASTAEINNNRSVQFPYNYYIERPQRRNRYSPTGYDPAIKLYFTNVTMTPTYSKTEDNGNVTVRTVFNGVQMIVLNFLPYKVEIKYAFLLF